MKLFRGLKLRLTLSLVLATLLNAATSRAAQPPPTIAGTGNVVINENATTNLSLVITDPASPNGNPNNVVLTVNSDSLPAVVPLSGLVFGGVGSARTLGITPAVDRDGTAVISIVATDTVTGLSSTNTFNVAVNYVNQSPVFTPGANISVNQNSGAYSQAWATGIAPSAAPVNPTEASQVTTFRILSVTPSTLFSSQPAVSRPGVLSFQPALNAVGTATVKVYLIDNGAGSPPSSNTSVTNSFTITINPVGVPPTVSTPVAQVGAENTTSAPINVTLTDVNDSVNNLVLSGTSSTLSLIGPTCFTFGGAGANRTISILGLSNQFGATTVTIGVSNTVTHLTNFTTFPMSVNYRNQAPVFTSGGNVNVNQNSGASSIPWATGIAPSAAPINATEAAQSVGFIVSNDNNPLFITQPAITPAGVLTFQPALNAVGVATVTTQLKDNSTTGAGETNASVAVAFTITVNPVAIPPTIATIPAQTGAENASTGPIAATLADVNDSVNNLVLSGTSANLSLVNPASFTFGGSGASRTVSILPLANQFGTTTVTIGVSNTVTHLTNSGAFTFNVNFRNQAPVFTPGGNVSANQNSGVSSIAWASGIAASAAPVNSIEAAQSVGFIVSNNNNPLFTTQPAITPAGVLSFQPALNAVGTATVTTQLKDNGTTGAGETNASTAVSFTITIVPVAIPPTLSTVVAQVGAENGTIGPISVTLADVNDSVNNLVLSGASANLTLISPASFTFGGSGANRTVTIAPLANQLGNTTVTVGVSNTVTALTNSITFPVNVNFRNQAPVFTPGSNIMVTGSSAYSAAWASGIAPSSAPVNATEAAQSVGFITGNDQNSLFSVQPAITPAGVLTFTPASNAQGTANVTTQLKDNGSSNAGETNGSVAQTFTITILPPVTITNHAPSFSLNLPTGGSVVQWGDNFYNELNQPAGLTGVTQIAAGYNFTIALKSDGTVVGWGNNELHAENPPAGLTGVTAVAACRTHALALKNDGTVVAWGDPVSDNTFGQLNVPAGLNNVVAIGAGTLYSVALKSDGTVVTWGGNFEGEQNVPPGLSGVIAIAAGSTHILALKSDGTVVGWGQNTVNEISIPPGLSGVVAISAGAAHSLALKSDGTVAVWGSDYNESPHGAIDVPPGLSGVVQITANSARNVVLKSDGSLVGWGDNSSGVLNPPANLGTVFSLAQGCFALATSVIADSGNSPLRVKNTAGPQSVAGFATSISPGPTNESNQLVNFIVTNDNNSIFSVQPAIGTNGTLTFTPQFGTHGSATVTAFAHDNGGTANGGVDTSAPQTFVITILRDPTVPPVISAIPAQNVDENATLGPISFTVSDVNDDPTNVVFSGTSDNLSLIDSSSITLAGSGASRTISITPHANQFGTANVSVTANNTFTGTTSSTNFTVVVNFRNQAPVFAPGANVGVPVNSAAYSAPWATGIAPSANPINAAEAAQTVSFTVANDNHALFSTQPAIDPTGLLSFQPANGAFGSANVSVQLFDNGTSSAGETNGSVAVAFIIYVSNPPTIGTIADQTVIEDASTASIPLAVSDSSGVGALVLSGTSSNTNLVNSGSFSFTAGSNPTMTITPSPGTFGQVTATVTVQNTVTLVAASRSFNINVLFKNHAPSFVLPQSATLYGAGQDGVLYKINPTNGATITSVGSIGFGITGLAYNPSSGILYGSVNNNDPQAGNLVIIDQTSGAGTIVGSFGLSGTLADITFTPGGTLYGWAVGSVSRLATVNLATGAASLIGTLSEKSFGNGLASSATGVLYHSPRGENGILETVNPVTGVPTTVATLAGTNSAAIGALRFDPLGNLYGVTTSDGNPLIRIDPVSGAVTTLGPTVSGLDALEFVGGSSNQKVANNAGAQTVKHLLTSIQAGPPSESSQIVTFMVTNDNNALFNVQPAIDTNGNLTYTPNPAMSGTATVTVIAHDNGGTDNGGSDTSAPQTFTITVTLPVINFVSGDVYYTRGTNMFKLAAGDNSVIAPFAVLPAASVGKIAWSTDLSVAYVPLTDGSVCTVSGNGTVTPNFATGLPATPVAIAHTSGGRILVSTGQSVFDVGAGGSFASAKPIIRISGNIQAIADVNTGKDFVYLSDTVSDSILDFPPSVTIPKLSLFGSVPAGSADLVGAANGDLFATGGVVTCGGTGFIYDLFVNSNPATTNAFATGQAFYSIVTTASGQLLSSDFINNNVWDVSSGGDFSTASPYAYNLSAADSPVYLSNVPVPIKVILR